MVLRACSIMNAPYVANPVLNHVCESIHLTQSLNIVFLEESLLRPKFRFHLNQSTKNHNFHSKENLDKARLLKLFPLDRQRLHLFQFQ